MPRLPRNLPLLLALTFAASAAAQAAPPVAPGEVDKMLQRGRDVLLGQTWEWLEDRHGRGVVALRVLGVPVDAEKFVEASKEMFRAKLSKCKSVAWRLVALERLPEDWPGRKKRSAMDLKLLMRCRNDRAFAYDPDIKPGNWSVEATHAAALGLRAAVAMGRKVPKKIWRGMTERLLERAADANGPLYAGGERFVFSNIAATITALSICRHYVPPNEDIAPTIERLWKQLDSRAALVGEPDQFATSMHVQLMQAGIASNRLDVAGAPWFDLGVDMLRETELDGGGWVMNGEPVPDTWRGWHVHNIEATLFLARAYRTVLIPPGDPASLTAISETSSLLDRARTVEAVVQRGLDARSEVLDALRSSVELRRSLAILTVLRLSGSTFGFRASMLPGSPEAKAAIREIKEWWPS